MNASIDRPVRRAQRHVMAASLLVVLIAAKLAVLWGRALPLSLWTPLAFLWQDIVFVLLFLLFERLMRNPWLVRAVYGAVVLLIAANVSVGRVLSTPLTAPLLRAARGTLSDSLRYHATPANLAITAGILVLAVALPVVLRQRAGHWFTRKARWAAVAAAVMAVLLGPSATARVDTAGLERNALFALARTSIPRVRAESREADWRASPFAAEGTAVDSPTRTTGTTAPATRERTLGSLRAAAAGYNVLVIALESTAAQYLRPYGATEDPTPNFTALASRSVLFENAYAVFPESIKGLVALLASRYPGFDVDAEDHARMMSPSLATVLAAHGYATALFHSGRFMYLGMEQIVAGAGFGRAEDAGEIGGNRNSSFGVDEAAAIGHILSWIDSLPRGRPFFATYLPIVGHHPYAYSISGPFPEDEEIDRYRNALYEGDVAIGELLTALRARGLEESTLLLVVGDHGEAFGQHRGNYGHNLAIYDENVRVPFALSIPGADAVSVERVASLIDVPPTILDLLGIRAPAEFQGESLLEDRPRMALFFTDYSLGLLGLRDGCIKYILELESSRSRMFDLCADPEERNDVGARQPERARRYSERLRQWSAAQVARVYHEPSRGSLAPISR